MAIGPNDVYGELNPEPEVDWPGELPAHIEEWNEWWWNQTFHVEVWRQYLPLTVYLRRPRPSPIAEDNAA